MKIKDTLIIIVEIILFAGVVAFAIVMPLLVFS